MMTFEQELVLAANKEGSSQPFLARKEHICRSDCFPVAAVTFFCFVCGEEIFKPQVARHGRRSPSPGVWETWYLCRGCHNAKIEEIAKNREETGEPSGKETEKWLKTSNGIIKQGPQGVPSDKTLKDRKRHGRFL